jgi:starch-binding outer membrane protein, SusD/RagB family
MKKLFINIFCVILTTYVFCTLFPGCKKFVQLDPPITKIEKDVVFENNTSAIAAMTGIYSRMITSSQLSSGNASIGYLCGLASDELTNYDVSSTINNQFYTNALTSADGPNSNYYFWTELYEGIYSTNSILSGLENSKQLSAYVKNRLIGEAKFIRAFFYFYAINLYGDVPLTTNTDYQVNNSITRSSKELVYKQIVLDLQDAEELLGEGFSDPYGINIDERYRPNKAAAQALLARVYLYTDKWPEAESTASKIIDNTTLYDLKDDLNDAFLKNNKEAIWQLRPVNAGFNTWDGYFYQLTSSPGYGQFAVSLSHNVIDSFEQGDKRYNNWIGVYSDNNDLYYYPNKYKIGPYDQNSVEPLEYTMVLRLSEQYLIRAEARARQGNASGAAADVNKIRTRARANATLQNPDPLPAISSTLSLPEMLEVLSHERITELFTEWGDRWFNLKRLGTINDVMKIMTPLKGGETWNSNAALLPIPLLETRINPKLTQNPGY